jgi:hypothetical protein
MLVPDQQEGERRPNDDESGEAAWPTLACVNNEYLSNLVNCIPYQLSQDAYPRMIL